MAGYKSLIGLVFGKLTVIELAHRSRSGKLRWKCQCECGIQKVVEGSHLTQNRTRSCGCLHRQRIMTRKGASGHSMYWIWLDMQRRCSSPLRNDYKYYGGRGIAVDARWLDFGAFVADMVERPSQRHTLDRINPNGNYDRSNCRWLDKSYQNSNKRNNRIIEFNGEVLTLHQWSDKLSLPESTIRTRLKNGLSIEQALAVNISKLKHLTNLETKGTSQRMNTTTRKLTDENFEPLRPMSFDELDLLHSVDDEGAYIYLCELLRDALTPQSLPAIFHTLQMARTSRVQAELSEDQQFSVWRNRGYSSCKR